MPAPDEPAMGEKKGIPVWIIIGGGLVVAYIIYRARQNAAAQQASSIYPGMGVTTTDTGVNPVGGTAVVPHTLQDWIAAAQSWARGNGYGATLVSDAIWKYTHGQRLTEKEKAFIEAVIAATGYPPNQLPIHGPAAPNPTKPKGPYFNWQTWKWWGYQPGSGERKDYLTEPKFYAASALGSFLTELGQVGGNILMPLANAPIYALTPGGLLQNDPNYNPKAPLRWRRIDNNLAFSMLPKGTKVATQTAWAGAAA